MDEVEDMNLNYVSNIVLEKRWTHNKTGCFNILKKTGQSKTDVQ